MLKYCVVFEIKIGEIVQFPVWTGSQGQLRSSYVYCFLTCYFCSQWCLDCWYIGIEKQWRLLIVLVAIPSYHFAQEIHSRDLTRSENVSTVRELLLLWWLAASRASATRTKKFDASFQVWENWRLIPWNILSTLSSNPFFNGANRQCIVYILSYYRVFYFSM